MLVIAEGSELHPNRQAELRKLAEWLKLDKVVYRDLGNREELLLMKGCEYLKLTANGNKPDGGWFSVSTPGKADESKHPDSS